MFYTKYKINFILFYRKTLVFSTMKIDRSFFDKFNNNTYIKNIKELGESIIAEIYNILSTRLKLNINLKNFNRIKKNPFDYGIIDLQSFKNIEQLSENIKQCILLNEPRIKECIIKNVSINTYNQTINFDIIFTIHNYDEYFQNLINIRY